MSAIEEAKGKWKSILSMTGVNPELLDGKHHWCPVCQDGKDRFRFADENGKGTYYCNQHGHGDGMDLLQQLNNWDFKTAAKKVESLVGSVRAEPIKPPPDLTKIKNRLNNMKRRQTGIFAAPSVHYYLNSRGISDNTLSQTTNHLGCIIGAEYWEGGSITHRLDSMMATITKNGKPITYHLTYTDQGKKADVKIARKIITPTEKFNHGFVKLFNHGEVIGVAEGIETALSVYEMFGVPCVAAINANSLAMFVPPEGVKTVHIFADNDKDSRTGQKVAAKLEERLTNEGFIVKQVLPSVAGMDWNDVLIEEIGLCTKST